MLEAPPVVDAPLFFLDYDGTLAPIVEKPMEAHPHPRVPDLLRALEQRYPVYIVTGRHLDDVAQLLPEPRLPGIGLHGTQEGVLGGAVRSMIADDVQQAIAAMREALPEIGGVVVEEKGETFAVHYREAADEEAVLERLQTWAAELPDELEVIWGKKVAEVRPKGSNKGVAVRRLAAEHPECTPVYLGDDVTDEDAFEALERLNGDGTDGNAVVTVRIGGGETRARYALDGPDEVVAYLRRYLSNGE